MSRASWRSQSTCSTRSSLSKPRCLMCLSLSFCDLSTPTPTGRHRLSVVRSGVTSARLDCLGQAAADLFEIFPDIPSDWDIDFAVIVRKIVRTIYNRLEDSRLPWDHQLMVPVIQCSLGCLGKFLFRNRVHDYAPFCWLGPDCLA